MSKRKQLFNYKHKKIIEEIANLDKVEAYLTFLRNNALTDEFVIYASGKQHVFIYSVAVPNINLSHVNRNDLMEWGVNPHRKLVRYEPYDDVWRIEHGLSECGSKTLEGATQLIFGRTFRGWHGPESRYYEINQEYAHLADIHWRPERRAYCHLDSHGDIDSVVSITNPEDTESGLTLVSFKWQPLEEYLAASDTSLVRMFEFSLPKQPDSIKEPKSWEHCDSNNLFYHQEVLPGGYATRTRGVQIICPRHPKEDVFALMRNQENKKYVEFTARDWRTGRITKISTDPSVTHYELSPAFFRPEVLSKYKADRDKYTVGERDVSCRAPWCLRSYDVNEAGQVHAYICDLRHLPYEEQLHWLSYNEEPKGSISERALSHDFKGEPIGSIAPLQKVLFVIRRWHSNKVTWWKLRDEKLLDCVNVPLADSRDEWANAFMDLSKLVVEGFEMKHIRASLNAVQVQYEKEDNTIALLENLLNKGNTSGRNQQLVGLRNLQHLRSKVKGHASGREAHQLAQDALMEHETFGNHFEHVCKQVTEDLETIERVFS